jgi:hypothetical protein
MILVNLIMVFVWTAVTAGVVPEKGNIVVLVVMILVCMVVFMVYVSHQKLVIA